MYACTYACMQFICVTVDCRMALEFDVTAESAVTDGDLASESRMRSQGCWKRYKAKRS